MAVVTTKSAQITNRDAIPSVINTRAVAGANVQYAAGVAAIANGDSVGSKLLFCSIPSNAVVKNVAATAPDIGTTTAMDVGLYRTTADGGAVVDADFYASALSLNGGAMTHNRILFESGVNSIANFEKRVWEILGLSADPKCMYDVVGTLTGAADAAGSVLIETEYTV